MYKEAKDKNLVLYQLTRALFDLSGFIHSYFGSPIVKTCTPTSELCLKIITALSWIKPATFRSTS